MNYLLLLLLPVALIRADEAGSCEYCQVTAHLLQYPKGGQICQSMGVCKDAVLAEKCELIDKVLANGLETGLLQTNPDQPKTRDPQKLILLHMRRRMLAEQQICHGKGTSNDISKADPMIAWCIECSLLAEVTQFVASTILGGPTEQALQQVLKGICDSLPIPLLQQTCNTAITSYMVPIFNGLRDSLTDLYIAIGQLLFPQWPNNGGCCTPQIVDQKCYSGQSSEGLGCSTRNMLSYKKFFH